MESASTCRKRPKSFPRNFNRRSCRQFSSQIRKNTQYYCCYYFCFRSLIYFYFRFRYSLSHPYSPFNDVPKRSIEGLFLSQISYNPPFYCPWCYSVLQLDSRALKPIGKSSFSSKAFTSQKLYWWGVPLDTALSENVFTFLPSLIGSYLVLFLRLVCSTQNVLVFRQ